MVYNWRDKNDAATFTERTGRIFDAATGTEVYGVFYWDTGTNHVGRYQKTPDGKLFERDASGRPIEVWEFRRLRVEWNDEADTPHVATAG